MRSRTSFRFNRSSVRTARVETRDFSKRRLFGFTDLVIRGISALGLVAIGVAGWMLQHETATQHARMEAQDREARKYLAMLHSMCELEFAFDGRLPASTINDDLEMRHIANALFVIKPEPQVTFHVPCVLPGKDANTTLETRCAITGGVRGVGLFMTELSDLCKIIGIYNGKLTVAKLAVDRAGNTSIVMPISDQMGGVLPRQIVVSTSRDSGPVWRLWMRRDVAVRDFQMYLVSIDFGELAGEVARCANDVIHEHPDLADRYISIRDEIARSRVSRPAKLPAVFPVPPAR